MPFSEAQNIPKKTSSLVPSSIGPAKDYTKDFERIVKVVNNSKNAQLSAVDRLSKTVMKMTARLSAVETKLVSLTKKLEEYEEVANEELLEEEVAKISGSAEQVEEVEEVEETPEEVDESEEEIEEPELDESEEEPESDESSEEEEAAPPRRGKKRN